MPQKNEAEYRRLISRVIHQKDALAFEQLVQCHQSPVRQFLKKLTGSHSDRFEDLAQDTFFQAYLHLPSYRGEGRFLSWLLKIAYQQFAKDYRRWKNEQLLPFEEGHDFGKSTQGSTDRKITLDQMLAALTLGEKAPLLLHYRFGMTHPEIADTLEVPLGTVKSQILRGKKKLRNLHSLNQGEKS